MLLSNLKIQFVTNLEVKDEVWRQFDNFKLLGHRVLVLLRRDAVVLGQDVRQRHLHASSFDDLVKFCQLILSSIQPK